MTTDVERVLIVDMRGVAVRQAVSDTIGIVVDIARQIDDWRKSRRARAGICALSDHLLADIGLCRSAFGMPGWGQR